MAHVLQVSRECQNYIDTGWQNFEDATQRLYEDCEDDIILDFTGIENINSHVMAAIGLLHTCMQENNRSLIITGLNEKIKRLFEITGLSINLRIDDTASIIKSA